MIEVIRRIVATSGVLTVLASGACYSYDPLFWDESEQIPLQQVPPAPYKIAIAPFDEQREPLVAPSSSDDELVFTLDAEAARQRIAEEMRRMHAGSEVVLVGADYVSEAQTLHADLLVRPRVRFSATLGNPTGAGRALTATLLWFTTWYFGLDVEETRYEARVAIDFDLQNPHDALPISSVTAKSETVDLSFWDRNPFWSWETAQSMIIPPFWTSDDTATTSAKLTDRVCSRLAARLTKYLKEELPAVERQSLGKVDLDSPINGADVGPIATLRGQITGVGAITELAIYVNEVNVQHKKMAELPPVAEQWRGGAYHVLLDDLPLQLAPGRNLVALEFLSAGQLSSRTLVLHNGREVAE